MSRRLTALSLKITPTPHLRLTHPAVYDHAQPPPPSTAAPIAPSARTALQPRTVVGLSITAVTPVPGPYEEKSR